MRTCTTADPTADGTEAPTLNANNPIPQGGDQEDKGGTTTTTTTTPDESAVASGQVEGQVEGSTEGSRQDDDQVEPPSPYPWAHLFYGPAYKKAGFQFGDWESYEILEDLEEEGH
jgi:hypothetical protein